MRHQVDGRKFGMNTSHRMAMFKSMANNLITHEHVVTTVAKAKELRRVVDRLITLGKKGNLASRRLAFDRTRNRDTVVKLFDVLAARYASRNGGYTRVLRLDDTRWGDGTEMAVVELVDRPILEKKKKAKKKQEQDHAGHDHDHEHDHAEKAEKKEAKAPKAPKAARDDSKVKEAGKSTKSKKPATTVRKSSSRGSGA